MFNKKMLAVVVSDVEVEGEYHFEWCQFASSPDHLRLMAAWLCEQEVEEVVMESTAQGRKSSIGDGDHGVMAPSR